MTDAVIPDLSLERATPLESAEAQTEQDTKKQDWVKDLATHPGWRQVEARLQTYLDKYRHPVFNPETPYEVVGREYMIAQTIAGILEKILDDVRPGD